MFRLDYIIKGALLTLHLFERSKYDSSVTLYSADELNDDSVFLVI